MLAILSPVVASKLTSYCPEGQLLMHTGEAGDCQVVAIKIDGAKHGETNQCTEYRPAGQSVQVTLEPEE